MTAFKCLGFNLWGGNPSTSNKTKHIRPRSCMQKEHPQKAISSPSMITDYTQTWLEVCCNMMPRKNCTIFVNSPPPPQKKSVLICGFTAQHWGPEAIVHHDHRLLQPATYWWWKKSCTSWWVVYPFIPLFYDGFFTSQVVQDFSHQQY